MAGRNAKPVVLHVIDGKAKLSKKEIERRQALEIKLGSAGFKMSDRVKADPTASAKFFELAEEYESVDFVTSSDSGIINQLCILTSELESLRNDAAKVKKTSLPKKQREVAYNLFVDEGGREYARSIMEKVDLMLSIQGRQAAQKVINATVSQILALEDRLFLNPLAKIKSIPKKQTEPDDPLASAGFGGL